MVTDWQNITVDVEDRSERKSGASRTGNPLPARFPAVPGLPGAVDDPRALELSAVGATRGQLRPVEVSCGELRGVAPRHSGLMCSAIIFPRHCGNIFGRLSLRRKENRDRSRSALFYVHTGPSGYTALRKPPVVLSPKQKLVYRLHHNQGLTGREIAQRMQVRPESIYRMLARARRRLLDLIQLCPGADVTTLMDAMIR